MSEHQPRPAADQIASPSHSGGPPRTPFKSVLLYLSAGLLFAVVASLLMGALFYELVGAELPVAMRPWLALALGLGTTLAVPIYLAIRRGKGAVSGLRIFAGCNLVTVMVLLGLVTALSRRALDHHGAWFSELAGERSPAWSERLHTVAAALPGDPLVLPDAGAQAEDGRGAEDASTAPAEDGPLSAQQVFAQAADAVVYIGVRADLPEEGIAARMMKDMGMKELEGHGSGFVVSPDGLLVTNHHVIGTARSAHVRLRDGRRFDRVTVLALDEANDLALVRIDATGLSPLALASDDEVAVGAAAYAIGSPLGMDFSLTAGIVSAAREQQQTHFWQIQTDIAPGSSGGPLLDDRARLIGVNTAGRAPGLNLAVQARHVRDLLTLPRQNNPLQPWRAAMELAELSFEGSTADPVTRVRFEQVAGLAGKILDGCREHLPAAGGVLELDLSGRLGRRPRSQGNLGESAETCMQPGLRRLGVFGRMAMDSRPELSAVAFGFRLPEGNSEDGGSTAVEDAGDEPQVRLVLRRKAAREDAGFSGP